MAQAAFLRESGTANPYSLVIDPDGDLILAVGEDDRRLLKVSSQVLRLSSPVWRVMLDGRFQEGQTAFNRQDPPRIVLHEDDTRAMITLCNYLHHRGISIKDNPDRLVELAIVCDKYDCAKAMVWWFRAHFASSFPEPIGRKSVFASSARKLNPGEIMALSYVFGDQPIFWQATRHMLFEYSQKVL